MRALRSNVRTLITSDPFLGIVSGPRTFDFRSLVERRIVSLADGRVAVLKAARLGAINDHEGKVAGVLAHAGKVPVFVAGNVRSGGDIAQLAYSQQSPYPSFQLLINHDDAAREFAYDEADGASLAAAQAGQWHVVSIKNDWDRVFAGPGS